MRFIFFAVCACVLISSCKESPVAPKQVPTIPTTTATGPGGPAYMRGTFRNYLKQDQPATNVHMYLMNRNDYTDTLSHVFVNSTDASFLITELPVDTIDLIIVSPIWLSAKIHDLPLRENHNSIHNLGSVGLWIDSTIHLVAIADSVPRPNMPMFGLLGYGNSLILQFRPGMDEVTARTLAATFPSDTILAYGDTAQGLILSPIYPPNTNSLIFQKLQFFNWKMDCDEASALLVQIYPKKLYMKGGVRAMFKQVE